MNIKLTGPNPIYINYGSALVNFAIDFNGGAANDVYINSVTQIPGITINYYGNGGQHAIWYRNNRPFQYNSGPVHPFVDIVFQFSANYQVAPGNYSITVDFSSPINPDGSELHQSVSFIIAVLPEPPYIIKTNIIMPGIPNLSTWQNLMPQLADRWNQPTTFCWSTSCETQVWYYDGISVYFNVSDYTGLSKYSDFAFNIADQFSSSILSGQQYKGWRVFCKGLEQAYVRSGDVTYRDAINYFVTKSPYAAYGGIIPSLNFTIPRDPGIRETSYILRAYLTGLRQIQNYIRPVLAGTSYDLIQKAVDTLLLDLWISISLIPDFINQTFYNGLAITALIEYYEVFGDPRIPEVIRQYLDKLWTLWSNPVNGQIVYDSNTLPAIWQTQLNLLSIPGFAWYGQLTGNLTYINEGDVLFKHFADTDLTYSGKIFTQNYYTSFDYVSWRGGK